MIGQPRIGLQRSRERKVRGEGVIDERYARGNGVICHFLRRADASDTSGIDLDEPDLPEVDQVQRHGR